MTLIQLTMWFSLLAIAFIWCISGTNAIMSYEEIQAHCKTQGHADYNKCVQVLSN